MRIVLHGQQAFGRAVLEKLLERGDDVVAVCVAPDKEGRPTDPLKELALEKGLPVHQPASWKTPEALELMRSFDADVCMMAYVLLFVPQPVLEAPKHGSFQYHPSILPMHRGPSSINWPIAQGATKTGLTIFWPDEGLDEGPILMQKHCDIGPDETLGDVYFKKLFPMGVDAMIESLDLVKEGKAPSIKQNLDEGSYESWFRKADAEVHWDKPASEIYNVIRAAAPQPGAWTTYVGDELKIFNAKPADGSGPAGAILEITDDGVVVACGEGALRLERVRTERDKIPAKDWATAAGVSVSDTLGS